MKSVLSKIVVVLLALALVCACAGCAADDTPGLETTPNTSSAEPSNDKDTTPTKDQDTALPGEQNTDTAPPADSSAPTELDLENGKLYRFHTLYDQTSGIPIVDVLLPEGWSGSALVDWSNVSLNNPGVALVTLTSPDSNASIYIYSIQDFVESSSFSYYINQPHYDHKDLKSYNTYLTYHNAHDFLQLMYELSFDGSVTLIESAPVASELQSVFDELARARGQQLYAGSVNQIGATGAQVTDGGYEGTVVIEKHRIDSATQGTLYTKGMTACLASTVSYTSYNTTIRSTLWLSTGLMAMIANSAEALAMYEADYDMIVSNSVWRNEFAHVNKQYGRQIYQATLQQMTAQNIAMTQSNAQSLMSSYDESSYSSDDWANDWSDFIYDRNSYTSLDGQAFKASTAYDSVYQSGDMIYMGPGGGAPSGWTQLTPN